MKARESKIERHTPNNAGFSSTKKHTNCRNSVDANPRRGGKAAAEAEARAKRCAGYDLAEDVRYNQRSSAERVNGNLKDNCGGNHVRVRGAPKVFCHLMFGILVVAVEQMMRLVT